MPAWLPGVLVALLGVIPGVLLFLSQTEQRKQAATQANRTAQLEERKADREELESALTFWKTSFDAVTLDNKELRREVGWCRRRIAQLERALRAAGVPIPENGEGPA